jgi:hypothetical protein
MAKSFPEKGNPAKKEGFWWSRGEGGKGEVLEFPPGVKLFPALKTWKNTTIERHSEVFTIIFIVNPGSELC